MGKWVSKEGKIGSLERGWCIYCNLKIRNMCYFFLCELIEFQVSFKLFMFFFDFFVFLYFGNDNIVNYDKIYLVFFIRKKILNEFFNIYIKWMIIKKK